MAIPKVGLTSQADIMLKTYMKQNKKATCAQKEEILKNIRNQTPATLSASQFLAGLYAFIFCQK